MGLEEHTVEEIKKSCERCGTPLTSIEIGLAMESGESVFLCTTCSSDELPSSDEELLVE